MITKLTLMNHGTSLALLNDLIASRCAVEDGIHEYEGGAEDKVVDLDP